MSLSLSGVVELATEVGQIAQTAFYHQRETDQAKLFHEETIDLEHKQHSKDIQLIKQTYLMDVFLNLEQHFQQLNADLIASSKESERDMFDQRNQQFQTIILSSSVMFSALSTVIIQGPLNQASSSFLLISYSLSTALAFALLFLSIVICIEIISRASKFMYRRARHQTVQLQDAISESISAMKKLRADTVENSNSETSNIPQPNDIQQSYQKQTGQTIPPVPAGKRRNFANGDPSMVENEWKTHEGQVFKFLKVREEINEKAWAFEKKDDVLKISDKIDASKVSFEEFWESRCQTWGEIAIGLFYVGSIMFLIGVMIFMWSEFYFTYSSLTGAQIAVTLIGVGMLLGVGIVIVLRYIRPPVLNESMKSTHINNRKTSGSGSGSGSGTDRDSDSAENGECLPLHRPVSTGSNHGVNMNGAASKRRSSSNNRRG